MFRAALFILICLILLSWSCAHTALFGQEYRKQRRTIGHSFYENSPQAKETTFSNLSYTAFTLETSPAASPVTYYQAYYDPASSFDADWNTGAPVYQQAYYDPNPQAYGDISDTFIDTQNQEHIGYYYYPEPGNFPEPSSPYFSGYSSIGNSGTYNGEEGGYGNHPTYRTFDPDINPISKELQLGWSDVKNLYTWSNAGNYGVMLGLMAIAANTSFDQRIADGYQKDIRCSATDRISSFWKFFGEGNYIYPIFISGALLGDVIISTIDEDSPLDPSPFGEYFSRTARAEVVAVPILLLGKAVIGAGRPSDGEGSSHWSHPFTKGYTSGISGHAYVGSIPFITLAQMSDSYCCKGIFYAASTLTGLSRINDNAHYFSQVVLGWYLGYLSCLSVTETETGPSSCGLTIFPLVTEDNTQIGFSYSY